MYDKTELPVFCDLWRLTTNLFKWYTSCHQLDHISSLDDYKWIPGFLSSAHSHASLDNIKLAFQFLWGKKKENDVQYSLSVYMLCFKFILGLKFF